MSGWLILFLLAAGPTLAGFGLYNVSLTYLPSSVVNLIVTLEPVMTALMKEVEARQLADIALVTSSCAGLCSMEPMVTVETKDEPPVKYVNLTTEKVKEIVEKHLVGGQIVTEYALSLGSERVL